MDEEEQRQRWVQSTIDSGRALVREAQYLLKRSRQQFAELGIDPEKEYEQLKAQGGDEAVERAGAEFQSYLEQIEAEVKRTLMHAQLRIGAGRHLRSRANKV